MTPSPLVTNKIDLKEAYETLWVYYLVQGERTSDGPTVQYYQALAETYMALALGVSVAESNQPPEKPRRSSRSGHWLWR